MPTEAPTDTIRRMSVPEQFYYQGHHVIVRPLEVEDVFSLYPRSEVLSVLPLYRPWLAVGQEDLPAVAERLRAIGTFESPPELEALVLHRQTLTPLGFLCLAAIDPMNAKAEFAAGFFRGRGSRPAMEAIHWVLEQSFSRLNLHKLIFYTLPENQAAQALLAVVDARLEGTLREELARHGGGRNDLARHSLLRPDWFAGSARRRLRQAVPLLQTTMMELV